MKIVVACRTGKNSVTTVGATVLDRLRIIRRSGKVVEQVPHRPANDNSTHLYYTIEDSNIVIYTKSFCYFCVFVKKLCDIAKVTTKAINFLITTEGTLSSACQANILSFNPQFEDSTKIPAGQTETTSGLSTICSMSKQTFVAQIYVLHKNMSRSAPYYSLRVIAVDAAKTAYIDSIERGIKRENVNVYLFREADLDLTSELCKQSRLYYELSYQPSNSEGEVS